MKIHKELRLPNPEDASEYILLRAFSDAEDYVWFQYETNMPSSWLLALSRDREDHFAQESLNVCLNLIAHRYAWVPPNGIARMKCMIDTSLDVSTFDWTTSPGTSSCYLVCVSPDTFDIQQFGRFFMTNLKNTLACKEACALLNKLRDPAPAPTEKKHPLERLLAAWPKDDPELFLTRQDGVTPLVCFLRDRNDPDIQINLHALDNGFYEVRSPMFSQRPHLDAVSPAALMLSLAALY
jgi:hypothetical protein